MHFRKKAAPTPTFQSDTKSPEATQLRNELEGTWRLASYEVHAQKPINFTRRPLGAKPSGVLIYTDDGHMSVQMQKSSKMRFMGGANPHGGFFWEKARAASHYMAYAGTFEVGRVEAQSGEKSLLVVEHAVQHSLFPNWIGTGQVRVGVVEGDRLTLRPHALPKILGVQYEAVLVWERCKESR